MIPLAAITLARKWWKPALGAVLGAALALPVGQCQGRGAERARQEARAAEAELRASIKNAEIKEKLSEERVQDSLNLQRQSKDRTDAIQSGPDDRVSAAQRRLNCQRLRDAGFKEADLAGRC